MEDVELIVPIKMALSPKVRNWVLFSNGTVVVIDDMTKEALSNLSTMGAPETVVYKVTTYLD